MQDELAKIGVTRVSVMYLLKHYNLNTGKIISFSHQNVDPVTDVRGETSNYRGIKCHFFRAHLMRNYLEYLLNHYRGHKEYNFTCKNSNKEAVSDQTHYILCHLLEQHVISQ